MNLLLFSLFHIISIENFLTNKITLHLNLANETLLRTLLSYCSLHGASGGGLASVRMELVLLLQELQQEKTQQQLLSPLPFPTTLPLLSACVAGNRTVIADPIRYLEVKQRYIFYFDYIC